MQDLAHEAALREQMRGIPDPVAPGGQQPGLFQIADRLGRHAGGEQQDQPARHREQVARRNAQQAEIKRAAQGRAAGEAERAAGQHLAGARTARGGDAVKEKNDFGAFAQHRDADYQGQRDERPAAFRNGAAHRVHLGNEVAGVTAHPDVVPTQHEHREEQHDRVEDLLAQPLQRARDGLGEDGDEHRTREAGGDAARDPPAAMRHPAGCREHDTHDQRGFEHLAKDDDEGGDHDGSGSGKRGRRR